MSTPLTKLPIKAQVQGDNTDLQDPLVQDVLKEFEEELAASKKTQPVQNYMPIPQQMPQQMPQQIPQQMPQYAPPHMPQYPHQQPPQQSSFYPKKNIIDFDLGRKVLIITIVILLLMYSNVFDIVYTKLPSNISSLATNFDLYIKSTLIFITLYILSLYEII